MGFATAGRCDERGGASDEAADADEDDDNDDSDDDEGGCTVPFPHFLSSAPRDHKKNRKKKRNSQFDSTRGACVRSDPPPERRHLERPGTRETQPPPPAIPNFTLVVLVHGADPSRPSCVLKLPLFSRRKNTSAKQKGKTNNLKSKTNVV